MFNKFPEADLSDSVLAYIEASRNRIKAFEQLLIEDVEEKGGFFTMNYNKVKSLVPKC